MSERPEARFFVLRTPALPVDDWEAWGEGLAAPDAADAELEAALAADRRRLRARLAAVLARPEVAEALFVASPSLHRALDAWHRDPDGRKGRRSEQALVRYFARMTGRPTPFGLFSGSSSAALDGGADATRLRLAPRTSWRRRSRLDMDFLVALADALARDPELWPHLVWRSNDSLHRAGDRWRFVETRSTAAGRSHHLVAAEASEALDDLLAFARGGVSGAGLVARLVAWGEGEIDEAEAAVFVGELIGGDLLVDDLEPALTGDDACLRLARRLDAAAAAAPAGSPAAHTAADAARRLEAARSRLAALDAGGRHGPAAHDVLAGELAALPVAPEASRLVQVDLFKPLAEARLGGAVVDEIAAGVDLLHHLTPRFTDTPLDRFRDAFLERWGEGREVPLLVAVDEESGLGFGGAADPGAAASPLLAGLPFPQPPPVRRWGEREGALLELLARGEPGSAVELTDDWIERLAEPDPLPPPDAFHVLAVLAAGGEEALAAGDFRVLLRHASGPSGARLLGRFCHADAALRDAVAEHLRQEEALQPDAVFAEVVHLPQGRMGNVIHRPRFGRREIPFLGNPGGADLLPPDDLVVTVRAGRVELRSRTLRRRVVPALTTAHDYDRHSLAVYRFLGALLGSGSGRGATWLWGPLETAPWTPRVCRGRLVLERARWRLSATELAALTAGDGAERHRRVRRWREARRVPRRVLLAEHDHELPVDLDNALSLDAFLAAVAGRPETVLYESFPAAGELCVRGPEGRFTHELVIPFVRGGPPRREPAPPPLASASADDVFPPGSEWLYAKVYCGPATADRVLAEVVAPLAATACTEGAADRWFFLRFGDPGFHLRVRFHGAPRRLHGEVLPALEAALAPWIADGRVARLQLDTYQRETERYGGPEAIAAAEALFAADSEAAARLVALLPGDAGADLRWRLALPGIDLLLAGLGLDLEARHGLLQHLRDGRPGNGGGSKELRLALDRRFREERTSLAALLAAAGEEEAGTGAGAGAGTVPAAALAVLHRRSRQAAPAAAELARLEATGRLHAPLAEVAASLVHMHVNRLLREAPVQHETVLYDFLSRLYASRLARERVPQPVA